MSSDRPVGHVRPDEPHGPLPVRAQRTKERSRPGGACGRDEDGEKSHAYFVRKAIFGPSGTGARPVAAATSAKAPFRWTSSAIKSPPSVSAGRAASNSKRM